ncbi:MAG: hypothetical protein JWO06_2848 [Bacteroidota bacterium]|nr:hypothetical protein [Bacteroidota bacterium]
MKQRFAINVFFLLFANLLVKPYWILGIDRVVQNHIGPDVYGSYFAVFNFSFLFSIILDFGINNFNSRAVSRNNKRLGEYLLNIMLLKIILSIAYLVITFGVAYLVIAFGKGYFTGFSPDQLKMLLLLCINQILLSGILYLRTNIAALQLFKTDAVVSVFDRLLTIVFCLVLIYAAYFRESFTIERFIYAQMLSLLLTIFIAFAIIISRAKIRLHIWKPRFSRMILAKSLPFALIALTMGIYYRIDGIMLDGMLGSNGANETGIYAASYRLLDAANMIGYLLSVILLPLFSSMIRKNENLQPIFRFSCELMIVISVITAATCFVFRSFIMVTLYPASNIYWADIFAWLMVSFIPISLVYVFGALLLAKGSLRFINYITLAGAVLNVVLNLVLIPKYGAMGATVATLITQILVIISFGLGIIKIFNFGFNAGLAARFLLFSVLSFGVAFLSLYFIQNSILSIAVACAVMGILAFATGTLTISDFIELKKFRNSLQK